MSLLAIHPHAQPEELVDRYVLGMAEMGYSGLSEQWLLRRAGDLHWRLIARAMGQKDAVFTCPDGQPLYAAFCVTSLRMNSPEMPRLGVNLTLSAGLYRIGQSRLASIQKVSVQGRQIGRVILISTFVGRSEPGSNRSIVRRTPRVLAMPPEAPSVVQRLARQAATVARNAVRDNGGLVKSGNTHPILPCPTTDFNAAGLLYFPSFSAIAERALFESGETEMRVLSARHVVYLGNVEPGERISVAFRKRASGTDIVLRGGDGRPLALMRGRGEPKKEMARVPN
ncbi:Pnap_2097 family protein [Rhizobium rosettiformans]|uniref:Pnap_2097 family protein n=1 Tax=Rhizobium rosettiformans TaxID=1368430 RepID=UPI002861EAA0|nr:Pnap_2097 family protein [Rhizobium rosettiformans]MDR7030878.1 putative biosynthetic protein (TIGR04099 family) [Rhizobium rosettiformans]MDR7066862.1 putative biosynthetic protein (TIGR04099 family) [Rhizobium rosettiformans]